MQRHAVVTTETEPDDVGVRRRIAITGEEDAGWALELHHRLRGGGGERLAGANQERNPAPAPRVDPEPSGHERLGIGPRLYPHFVGVAPVLTANDLRRLQRPDLTEELRL